MTSNRTPWPYAEAQAHLGELLDLAANGEPQRIVQPDGTTLVVLATRTQTVEQRPRPFRSGLSTFLNAPRDDDFNADRIQDPVGDIDL